jgi:prepilin-type N-terminal cleavage/methylation domain-containing protein
MYRCEPTPRLRADPAIDPGANRACGASGFTLLELLVVLVIIGLLGALIVTLVLGVLPAPLLDLAARSSLFLR